MEAGYFGGIVLEDPEGERSQLSGHVEEEHSEEKDQVSVVGPEA